MTLPVRPHIDLGAKWVDRIRASLMTSRSNADGKTYHPREPSLRESDLREYWLVLTVDTYMLVNADGGNNCEQILFFFFWNIIYPILKYAVRLLDIWWAVWRVACYQPKYCKTISRHPDETFVWCTVWEPLNRNMMQWQSKLFFVSLGSRCSHLGAPPWSSW